MKLKQFAITTQHGLPGGTCAEFFAPTKPTLAAIPRCGGCKKRLDRFSDYRTAELSAADTEIYQPVIDMRHCAKCNRIHWSAAEQFAHLREGCWHYCDIEAIPRTSSDPSSEYFVWDAMCSYLHAGGDPGTLLIAMMPLLRQKAGLTPPNEHTEHEGDRSWFQYWVWASRTVPVVNKRTGRRMPWDLHGDRMSIAVYTVAVELEKARTDKEHFLHKVDPDVDDYDSREMYQKLANKSGNGIRRSEYADRNHGVIGAPQPRSHFKRQACAKKKKRLKRHLRDTDVGLHHEDDDQPGEKWRFDIDGGLRWDEESGRFDRVFDHLEGVFAVAQGILDKDGALDIKGWLRKNISDPIDRVILWLRRERPKFYKTTGWVLKHRSYATIGRRLGLSPTKVRDRLLAMEKMCHEILGVPLRAA